MKAAEAAVAAAPAGGRADALETALELCIYARDRACLARNFPVYTQANTQAGVRIDPGARMRAAAAVALLHWLDGDVAGLDRELTPEVRAALDPAVNTFMYIETQRVLAEAARAKGDFVAAAEAVDRGFAAVLLLGPESRLFAARSLVGLIDVLARNGDTLRAVAWLTAADPFLRAALPPASYEYMSYLETAGAVWNDAAPESDIAKAIHAEIPARLAALQRGGALTEAQAAYDMVNVITMAAYRGDRPAAEAALAAHPLAARRDDILRRAAFANFDEMMYADAEIFTDVMFGRPMNAAWAGKFAAPPAWFAAGGEARRAQQTVFFLGRALTRATSGPAQETQADVIAAARERVALVQDILKANPDAFILAGPMERITFGLAIPALVAALEGHPENADTLAAIREILAHGLRDITGDALQFMTSRPDEDTRRAYHAYTRLGRQKADWERRQIGELIGRLSPGGAKPDPAALFRLRLQEAELSTTRGAIRAAVMKTAGDSPRALPAMKALQDALQPGEALVAHFANLGQGAGLCVRKDKVFAVHGPLDGRKLILDRKLLNNALTASYPADDALDSQYPVDAAVELYNVLLAPLAPCLEGIRHLIYIPAPELAGLPLGALLERAPEQDDKGYLLAKAPWVGARFAIATVSSFSAFLSNRRIAARAGGPLPFLGFGDPKLARAPHADLAQLDELPETAAELTAVSKLFPKPVVIAGAGATEIALRSQPLSQFNAVEFATHGLVREEIPGLQEAALVGTPRSATDPFDDGLISASEIAGMQLRARLVVLSACNTANLDLDIFGAQVQGLSAAFSLAGAPTIVASLWPVDSAAARDTMVAMFTAWRGGAGAADALQGAQAAVRAGSRAAAHPRFWAPFIVVGEPGSAVGPMANPRQVAAVTADATGGEWSWGRALAGDMVLSGTGNLGEAGAESRIERVAADGASRWVVADRAFIQGPVAAGAGVFAGGSRRVPTLGELTPAMRYISPAGKVEWVKDVGPARRGWVIADIAVLPDGAAVAAVAPLAPAAGARPEDLQPELWRVDKAGATRMMARLPVFMTRPRLGSDAPVKLAFARGRIFAAVDTGVELSRAAQMDTFHIPTRCLDGGTQFFTATVEGAVTTGPLAAGLTVKALTADGKDVLVAGGKRTGCDQRQSAVVAALDDGLVLKPVWQDDTPFDSQAVGVARVGAGYRIAGNIARRMLVNEDPAPAPSSAIHSVTEGRVARDAFIVDPAKPRERWYYDAGLDTMIDGMVAGSSRLAVYGLQGPARLWLSVAP